MIQIKPQKRSEGFALLITILVLSVVVAVTLALVELSLKQLKLAVDSTDSEIAFHAANAGLECARHVRNKESDDFESGSAVTVNCFGSGNQNVPRLASLGFVTDPSPLGANGRVYRYKNSIEWGSGTAIRCTTMDFIVMVATSTIEIGSTASPLENQVNGFENDTKTCFAGERCTIMSVTGYSSPCTTATSSPGVLKREILIEL